MTHRPPSAKSSRLLREIREKLSELALGRPVLRVSVALDPTWEPNGRGDLVHVRWMCWSIEEDGREVVAPEFDILSPAVTGEQLARELPVMLEGVSVVVDSDIEGGEVRQKAD